MLAWRAFFKESECLFLFFLHGLLGSKHDWQNVIENLPHFSCLALDLPFHDDAKTVCVTDFEQTCAYVEQQLQQLSDQPYYLVGYSLGGRIALYYALLICLRRKQNPLTWSDLRRGEFRFTAR